ncbi:hypothetical protein D3C76_1752440 [compost metagenome]
MEQYRSGIACKRFKCRADHLFYRRHAHLLKGFVDGEHAVLYIRQSSSGDIAGLKYVFGDGCG